MVFNHGILHQILHRQEQTLHLFVLFEIVHNGVVGWKIGQTIVDGIAQHIYHGMHILTDTFIAAFFRHRLFYVGHMIGTNFSHTFFDLLLGFGSRQFTSFEGIFYLEKRIELFCIHRWKVIFHSIVHIVFNFIICKNKHKSDKKKTLHRQRNKDYLHTTPFLHFPNICRKTESLFLSSKRFFYRSIESSEEGRQKEKE